MVLAKSKKNVGLGSSLMHDRLGGGKGSDRKKIGTIRKTGVNGESYVTDSKKQDGWYKMRSVTEQAALDEFLATAELAGTDFTAEKMNAIKVISTNATSQNPYLLSARQEQDAVRKQKSNKARLTVPRRPKWDNKTTPQELDERERESFLDWRRGLAEVQETKDLLMTPFERNLEVWRQLWRVIERCELVVQIVDARSPLLFRCEDLEAYVKEVGVDKRNLLLVNKADLLTLKQRQAWADYFAKNKISYRFFSAALAKQLNEERDAAEADVESSDNDSVEDEEDHDSGAESESEESEDEPEDDLSTRAAGLSIIEAEAEDDKTRILTVEELEELFLRFTPEDDSSDDEQAQAKKIQIGLVGYPNVGKSSTINALIGAKKVSVSSTPGKTKHFQTIHLSDTVILCDCPGLVFPNFANNKADLVCNGVLPIDQLREFTGPAELVARRIPQSFLEQRYGFKVAIKSAEEGGSGIPTGSELLIAYAKARGFTKSGKGQPDESRAARYILKDYVNGRLLWCSPPPAETEVDEREFNSEHYTKAVAVAAAPAELATDDDPSTTTPAAATTTTQPAKSQKTVKMDAKFFPQAAQAQDRAQGKAANEAILLARPFHAQYTQQALDESATGQHGKQLTGRKQRVMDAISGVEAGGDGKKHFKANRRVKARNKNVPLDD